MYLWVHCYNLSDMTDNIGLFLLYLSHKIRGNANCLIVFYCI